MSTVVGKYIGMCIERYGVNRIKMLDDIPESRRSVVAEVAGDYLAEPNEGTKNPRDLRTAIELFIIAKSIPKLLTSFGTAKTLKQHNYCSKVIDAIEAILSEKPDERKKYEKDLKEVYEALIEAGENSLEGLDSESAIKFWELADSYRLLDDERKELLESLKIMKEKRYD